MIVDDDPQHRLLLAEALAGDFEVKLANSGFHALALARASPVHLILLDVDMPGLDGYQTCAILKRHPATAPIPVIFLTGQSEPQQEVYGLQLGAVDYLKKPCRLSVLRARVWLHLAQAADRRQLELAARVDALTGVLNHLELDRLLQREWQAALRRAEPLALVLLDVDNLGRYNARYGQAAGDRCLQRVASAIAGCPRRPEDALGRCGGGTFLVVLPQTTVDGACRVAEFIRSTVAALELSRDPGGSDGRVSVSLGVAGHLPRWRDGRADRSLQSLRDETVDCLRQAKRNGKNRVAVASPAG